MATALPSGELLAATFSPELAFKSGVVAGSEARAKGFNVLLAGGVKLARDVRGGPNFEYAGEDPYWRGLSSVSVSGGVSTVKIADPGDTVALY